jgi:GAF domain-containing protein
MTNEKNYFHSFCKLSRAFGTAATKNELLDLIVQNAIDTMAGKAACLFLADEKQDVFIPVAQSGLSDTYMHANPVKARRIVKALVKEGHLAFADATSDPRLENHAAKKAEGIASILTVPVMVRDRPIGILSLYTAKPREFDEDEIQFLRALAEQGGMALEKARLLDRIQNNAMLYLELASHINSSLDIKNVLNNLTVEVCKALGMKGAVIRLLDQKTDTLRIVASHGLSPEFLAKGETTASETTALALKGETLTISDVATDKRITHREALIKEGIGAIIITPIKAREEVIGVLRLYSDTPRRYPADVIVMVQALAHQGGLAIQNATLYLKLQEDKKNLEEDAWSHRSWF